MIVLAAFYPLARHLDRLTSTENNNRNQLGSWNK